MANQGFSVDTTRLFEAGHAAATIGDTISELATEVVPASDVQPAPDGWQIGARLLDAVPLWERQLNNISAEAKDIGHNLRMTAADYSKTDTGGAQLFGAIRS
jgi:hypothetical protein